MPHNLTKVYVRGGLFEKVRALLVELETLAYTQVHPQKPHPQSATAEHLRHRPQAQPQHCPPPLRPATLNPLRNPIQGPETILVEPYEDIKNLYTLGKELGRGQFGIIYLCCEISRWLCYACKSILKRKLVKVSDKEDIRREIQIMQHLKGQQNMVEFKRAHEDQRYVHLVVELCDGGNIFDRIIAQGHYSERAAVAICRLIISVVHISHFMGVMHRDLKPKNFLLSSKNEGALLKATDFGLSVFIKEGNVYRNIVGSASYVAPEVLKRKNGKEIDVWSAGVMLYILFSGVPPFWAENEKGVFEAILLGEINFASAPSPTVSSSAKDLVLNMLTHDPNKRFTAGGLLMCAVLIVRPDLFKTTVVGVPFVVVVTRLDLEDKVLFKEGGMKEGMIRVCSLAHVNNDPI